MSLSVYIGAFKIGRRNTLCCQSIGVLLGNVTGIVVLVDVGFVQESIILSDKLVGTVIGVGALGDDRTVPLFPAIFALRY